MKFEKIVQAFPLIAVMQFSPSVNAIKLKAIGEVSEPNIATPDVNDSALTPDLITSTIDRVFSDSGETFHQTIPNTVQEWSAKMDSRFDELVTKEAVGKISKTELDELERLQKARRRHHAPPSGEEVLQRHKREKLDLQLLNLLQKNVRVHALSTYSS
jgi:hypothetical protein